MVNPQRACFQTQTLQLQSTTLFKIKPLELGTKQTKSTLKTGKIFRTRPKKPGPRLRYAHTLCSQPLKPSPRSPSQSETGGCRVETFEASTQCCKVCYISCCHFKYHDDCCYCCYQCGCDRFHFHLEARISLWLHRTLILPMLTDVGYSAGCSYNFGSSQTPLGRI